MNSTKVSVLIAVFLASLANGQLAVTTAQYNNLRTGANMQEPYLNTTVVRPGRFGKLFSRMVDSSVYALPLIVPRVDIPGKGRRNVVYVATMGNTVYAYDSDNALESAPLWVRNLGPSFPTTGFIRPSWGILSTPVIDFNTRTMYLVAYVGTAAVNASLFLAALDITTGADKFGPPAEILFPAGGRLVKATQATIQRPALLLTSGALYIAFANFRPEGAGANPGDPSPVEAQEGFVFAYGLNNLTTPFARFQVTPNGLKGGIWQAGRGLSTDAEGFIYAVTAGGSYNGTTDFGSSIVKLAPQTLQVVDWFTPQNHEFLYLNNLDPSAGGAIVVPGTPYLIAGGKTGIVYLRNRSNLGKLETTTNRAAQSYQATTGCGLTDCAQTLSTTFWNRAPNPMLFVWDRRDVLRAFRFGGSSFQTTPASVSAMSSEMSGGVTVSSNGSVSGTGIVWAITSAGNANVDLVPGTVRAFDANNVSRELWNSDIDATRDSMGFFTKFSSPVVANGKVYAITHSNRLQVYGSLIGTTAISPSAGSGSNQVFTAMFSHPNGAAALAGGNILFNSSLTGVNACWLYHDRAANSIALANDDATVWTSARLGAPGSLSNSRCFVNLGGSSASVSGDTITLRVSLAFKSLFAGTKNTYTRLSPISGNPGPFELKGTWSSL